MELTLSVLAVTFSGMASTVTGGSSEWLSNAQPFESFFHLVTGHAPHRWQGEAANAIAAGTPPSAVAVPTGMGKTSLMVCWLWALASDLRRCASDPSTTRRVPLRYVVVVDRRVVVDDTVAAARRLADVVQQDTAALPEGVAWVAHELRSLLDHEGDPVVEVRELRGGMPERPENVRRPAAPAIVVGTVDLMGSRLLWRGYGVARQRRPIEAALLGLDTLFVLDESHIAGQFLESLRVLDRQSHDESRFNATVPGRYVIEVSATPANGAEPFDWNREIEAEPGIALRRDRRRAVPVEIVETDAKTGDAGVIKVAAGLPLSEGECHLVYANTPATAKRIGTAASRRADVRSGDAASIVLVGGMPELFHSHGVGLAGLDRFRTGTPGRGAGAALFVHATQTLEVGADIDGDHLTTPIATVEALTQRLGRVNRVGARPGGSVRIVLGAGRQDEPVYGSAATALGEALRQARPSTLGELEDFLTGPDRLSWQQPARARAVLPRHVFDAYVRTSGSPHEPPVGRWLRPPADPRAEVVVAFRNAMTDIDDEGALVDHIRRHPPTPAESWTVPIDLGAEIVRGRAPVFLLDPTGTAPVNRQPEPGDLRPGWILVTAPQADAFGIPGAGDDLISSLPPERRPYMLVCAATTLDHGDVEGGDDATTGPERQGQSGDAALVARAQDGDIGAAAELLLGGGEEGLAPVFTVVALTGADGASTGWLEVTRARGPREPVPDAVVLLSEHQDAVAARTRVWAKRLRLPEAIVDDVTLAAAHHDDGKLEDIVQRELRYRLDADGNLMMLPAPEGDGIAKSSLPRSWWTRVRRLIGLPRGYRHEAASAAHFDTLLANGAVTAHDPQLVRHLILTHHGWFRGPGPSLPIGTVTSPAYQDPERREWLNRTDEFVELVARYGPYTLALAEALVRLADWRESRIILTPPAGQAPENSERL